MHRHEMFRVVFAAIAVALMPAAANAVPAYSIAALPTGPFVQGTVGLGINSAGHITGYGVTGTGDIHAFIYSNGVFQDLGLLGYGAGVGISINGTDQLAADGETPGTVALRWSAGHIQHLGSVDGGFTYASQINNPGNIVGSALNGDGARVGFSWIGGTFTDLSVYGLYKANSLNDTNEIVGDIGYYWTYGGYIHSAAHGALLVGTTVTDLGNITGDPRTNTEAFDINNAGQIVGYSQAADGWDHAFLYSGGAMQDLGTMGAENATAVAINTSGLIVGNLTNAYSANLGAFVYADGAMHDLGDLIVSGGTGWSGLTVAGLNDGGVIIGTGLYNGTTVGFVATPQATGVAAAPAGALSRIAGARPNPFNPATEIPFNISQRAADGDVRLEIYDPAGRRIATLVNQQMASGEHAITWDGRAQGGAPVPSGVYFARLTTRDGTMSQKLVLTR